MRGLTGQAAVACVTCAQQMRHGRHHHVDRADALLHAGRASRRRCRRASRSRRCGCPASPARSADRRGGAAPRPSFGRSLRDLLDQRMADIAAGRPAELAMHVGLERQQRQHVVDVAAHRCARAPAARPTPTARRSRRSGSSGSKRCTKRATQSVKAGLSMITSTCGRRASTARTVSHMWLQDARQPARDRGEADDREIVDRQQARRAPRRSSHARRRRRTAAARRRVPAARASARRRAGRRIPRPRPGKSRPRRGARRRAGWRARAHGAVPSASTPMTKILARSAAAAIALRLGDDRRARQPRRCRQGPPRRRPRWSAARWSADRCDGPGRASAALTSTPVPAGERMRPLRRNSATRASIWSVPSGPSTAST